MRGKDVLKLLLIAYGFDKIKITTYRGFDNAQGYEIHAANKNGDCYDEENCEGLMFNITFMIDWMKAEGIEPTYRYFDGGEYSIKELLEK